MILFFRCRETEALLFGFSSRRFRSIERGARTRLARLHAATSLGDLAAIPGNRLEALKGTRLGQHGIRNKDQWRIGFTWRGETPTMSKSRTTTKKTASKRRLPPIHPGEVLAEDLQDLGLSLNQLARALRVPMNRISAIANGKRSITADTAMRLARYFGTSPQYWMNLQTAYDLAVAERTTGEQIEQGVLPRRAA